MRQPHRLDKTVWIVALSSLFTLSGVSLLFCPTAHAGDATLAAPAPSDHTPTEAAKTAMTLQSDDDGDELLEHWSDPKFSREERLQTFIILGALAGAGGISAYRRHSARRNHRHG